MSSTSSSPAVGDLIIRLTNVSKTYQIGDNVVRALKPTSLDFVAGEFVAIMGQSGSGKSTMLNLLGMLDQPTDGEYQLLGRPISGLPDRVISDIRCRSIGFIFQSFNLFPSISILENVCMPMRYAEVPRREMLARAEHLLDMVGLSDRLKHQPTELSGGQCQRVAVARSLANNPPVILADEPTGNLDEKTGDEVLQIFHDLKGQGRSVLMVTHNPEYRGVVDRVISLHDGVATDEVMAAKG